MSGRTIAIAVAAVLGATALTAAMLARHNPEDRSAPPATSGDPPPTTRHTSARADLDLEKTRREVLIVAKQYTAAITARDEVAAARFTCRKRDGGLLWISAVGRPIEVLEVADIGASAAVVTIRVTGKPPSSLSLKYQDGAWCIWP